MEPRSCQIIQIEIGIGIGIAIKIVRGSALECAAIQDVLVVGKALAEVDSQERKIVLDRMAVMLSRLGGRGYCGKEGSVTCGDEKIDFDPDSDFDFEESKS